VETSFLKLVDQTRLNNYLGLKMVEGHSLSRPTKSSRNYAYIEIPVLGFRKLTSDAKDGSSNDPKGNELSDKAARNSFIEVVPACTVNVRGNYRFEVHPSAQVHSFGIAQGMYYLEPEDGELIPSYRLWLRKDIELSDLNYAIRIYMRT